MTLPELLRDYGPAFAWSIIAIGWVISNRHENRRERRKEIRTEIVEVSSCVKDALIAVRAHQIALEGDAAPGLTAQNIVTDLREVDLRLERLLGRRFGSSAHIYRDRARVLYEDFYDFASGDRVMTGRPAESERGGLALELHASASLFLDALHQLFLAEFDSD